MTYFPYKVRRARPEERKSILKFAIEGVQKDWKAPVRQLISECPAYKPRHSLLVLLGGKIVGQTMFIPAWTRIAGVKMRTGRIHWVGVDKEHRRKGIGKIMMRWWSDHMDSHRFDLAWVIGIPNYYERFGYYYALPGSSPGRAPLVSIKTELAARALTAHKVRNMRSGDMEDMRKLFNRAYRFNSGELIYDAALWRYMVKGLRKKGENWIVSVDRKDSISGFGKLCEREGGIALSNAAAKFRAASSLLRYMSRAAAKNRADAVDLLVPQDHAIAQAAYELGGEFRCPYETYPGSQSGMVRIANPLSVLKKLSGVLSHRVEESRLKYADRELSFSLRNQRVAVGVKSGKVTVRKAPLGALEPLNLSEEMWTQILVGYRDIRYFVERDLVDLKQKDVEFLTALFPRMNPFLCPSF